MGRIEFFPFNTREEADAFQDEQVKTLRKYKLAHRYKLGRKEVREHGQTVYVVVLIDTQA
jgi:hypothetical protein